MTPPPIEYWPGVTIQWIFRWIMTLPSCWILIAPLNFDTLLTRNSTGRRYVDGSRPRVTIQREIRTLGHNSTWNHDPGSQFNMEFWPGVKIQRGIMTRGQYSTWNHDPGSQFEVGLWPGVTIQRGNMTRGHKSTWNHDRGHNSTWNYDPGSQFNVESWPMVTILLVIRSVTDVLRVHCGLTPYTFYKPTLGPQYVSNRPYNEFITPTTFI